MSGAVTAFGAAVVGSLVANAFAPDAPTANVPKATPAPQASQAPSVQGVRQSVGGNGQGGGAPGAAGTLLTGAGGIDPKLLQLGKSSLLGG